MCKAPKNPPPAKAPPPAPPPPAAAPVAPVAPIEQSAKETSKRSGKNGMGDNGKKRTGVSALRVDLNIPQPGGSGLNIPRG